MGSRPGPVPPPGAARPAPGPVNHCSRRRSVERSERKSRPGAEPQAQAGLGWAWPSVGGAGLASRSPPRPKGLLSWGALSRLPSSLPKPAHKSHKAAQPQLSTRPQHYGHAHKPCTGTYGLPSMSLEVTRSLVSIPGERAVPTEIHPDPLTWTQAPPTADQSFLPGALAVSPTPPESGMNQAVLDPFLRGGTRD